MTARYILAHDLGTTGNKASLYNDEGALLASAFYGYGLALPKVGWAEQEPEEWWQAVCGSTQQLLHSAAVPADQIACVVFRGQMMGCVLVDRQARPLRSALIWADMRAEEEAQAILDRVGMEGTYRITGHRASSSYSGPKLLWVRTHQPDIFRQSYKVLQAKDFIAARLTGNFVTDHSDASATLLYDLQAGEWSDVMLDAAALDRQLLPELHASSDVVGEVTTEAAAQTGLAVGTPVVIGGGDGPCATVGAGVVAEGSAYNYIGSSSWIGLTTSKPVFDPTMRTFTFAHLVPGLFSPCGTMQAAGASYQWLRDSVGLPEKEAAAKLGVSAYDLLNLQAAQSPPGANGLLFLPYLLGERSPRWNPQARGAFLGLTMKHTRPDMIRAGLEGVAFNLRLILEAFLEQGTGVDAMRVIGGGARGRLWRQIMADIYGLPVLRPAILEEATSMGAAIAGGVGVGLFPEWSVAERLTPIVDTCLPDPALKPLYDRQYALFNRAYTALEPLFDEMA